MSAGQGIGILAFMLYVIAIVIDLRRARRESQQDLERP
jgi:hypothetical protein